MDDSSLRNHQSADSNATGDELIYKQPAHVVGNKICSRWEIAQLVVFELIEYHQFGAIQ